VPGLLGASALYTLAPFLGIVGPITFFESDGIVFLITFFERGDIACGDRGSRATNFGATSGDDRPCWLNTRDCSGIHYDRVIRTAPRGIRSARGIRCAHGAAVELVRRRRGAGSARWRGYPRRGYEEHSPITANKAALLIWQPPSLALSWPPYYQGEMNPP
jgi:hypothetical protein